MQTLNVPSCRMTCGTSTVAARWVSVTRVSDCSEHKAEHTPSRTLMSAGTRKMVSFEVVRCRPMRKSRRETGRLCCVWASSAGPLHNASVTPVSMATWFFSPRSHWSVAAEEPAYYSQDVIFEFRHLFFFLTESDFNFTLFAWWSRTPWCALQRFSWGQKINWQVSIHSFCHFSSEQFCWFKLFKYEDFMLSFYHVR